MSKFKRELVSSYINNELDDSTREELEHDYNFIIFMLENYYFDKDLICDLIDEYLEYERDDVKRTEVLIRGSRLFDNFDNKYNKELMETYTSIKYIIESTINQTDIDIDLKEELQSGFYFIYETYGNNNMVLEYFASLFIEDYFREIDLLEKVKEKDKSVSLTMFLLNLLSHYDSVLASYVSSNIKLLDSIKESIGGNKKKHTRHLRLVSSKKDRNLN